MREGDDDKLRSAIPGLRRYALRPNTVFGEPALLSGLCRVFGFRNACQAGHVFLTDTKIQVLEQLGLPPPADQPLPEMGGGENDVALGAQKLRPPTEGLLPFDRMPIRERACAALLALKHGYRVLPDDWSYHPVTGEIVVQVPGVVVVWAIAKDTIEQALDELGLRGWRTKVEEIINV